MSRDPDRIDPFLQRLGDLWHRVPSQRFGQLLMNLSRIPGGFADMWEWDDVEFDARIRSYLLLHYGEPPTVCLCDPPRERGQSWEAHQPGCPLRDAGRAGAEQ